MCFDGQNQECFISRRSNEAGFTKRSSNEQFSDWFLSQMTTSRLPQSSATQSIESIARRRLHNPPMGFTYILLMDYFANPVPPPCSIFMFIGRILPRPGCSPV